MLLLLFVIFAVIIAGLSILISTVISQLIEEIKQKRKIIKKFGKKCMYCTYSLYTKNGEYTCAEHYGLKVKKNSTCKKFSIDLEELATTSNDVMKEIYNIRDLED